MAEELTQLALVTAAGARYPVRCAGVVIGRSARCDLIVDGPSVSRMQAIVYPEPEGALLVVLGRGVTRVNGRTVEGSQRLVAGDQLELDDARYQVLRDDVPDGTPSEVAWMIRDRAGQLYGINRPAFVIGGGPAAALQVAGWPERVMVLHRADRLHVEAIEPITVGGRALAPGELAGVARDEELAYAEGGFRIVAGGAIHSAATAGGRGAPAHAMLELLPRGGRLVLGWHGHEVAVYLPERRCELVALLLQPPAPYAAGELIPDEVVGARLRVDRPLTRIELNVIIHRARGDLVRAGLDGSALIERAAGGVATRFLVETSARVAVL